jgi:hypothetical protein
MTATFTHQPGALLGSVVGESREAVYNAVTASGENLSDDFPPVTATVVDSDPTSPTRWDGPWGKRRRFYASPLLTSTGQASRAAAAILATSTGQARTLTISAVCNPALEDGDVIYHDGKLFIADSFSISTSPAAGMSIATRSTKGAPA